MNKLKKIFLTAVVTLTVVTVSAAGEEPAAESYRNNRHPLLQKDYIQLPLGTIRAEGWMHDQLTRMRDGMTGHLDKVYTKVMGPRNDGSAVTVTCGNGVRTGSTDFCRWLIS